MKTISSMCALWLLAGCATPPQLTAVVHAPVHVSCATTTPEFPVLLTPCKADAPLDKCFQDYQIDNALLLGYVAKLIGAIRACQ
jgi:uncharacterized lipoprotein YajG